MLGAVLAGGESRRFGEDKASALLAGKPLVTRAAEALARVFDDVVIVSSRDLVETRWARVPDEHPGHGPLAGIEAALLRATATGRAGAFVLACDLPLVDEVTVRSILRGLGDRLAAAASLDGNRLQPLCAAYRVECLPVVVDAIASGRLAAHEMFTAVGGVHVALPGDRFLNVNTPWDHARAAAVVEQAPTKARGGLP
jgi:molybdopterin-guanine dinucleotide biosynthesis protein A